MRTDFEIPDKLFVFTDTPGRHIIHWTIVDETNIEPTEGELVIEVK